MAASARVSIMKGKGKSDLKSNKGNKKRSALARKKKPLYKTKLRGNKRKRAPEYDSNSDEEENTKTPNAKDEEMDEEEDEKAGSDSEDEARGKGHEGWADVMTKILNSSKDKKSVILSRALTDRQLEFKRALKQEDFEIEQTDKDAGGEEAATEKEAKPQPVSFKEMKREFVARREEKKCWESMGRVKPDITARQKERALQRIATRGIVHLFNAVKQRQTTIETKMKEVHGSEVKREKILKSMTKGDFLDVLKSKAKSIPVEDAAAFGSSKSSATTSDEKPKTGWNIFRDDYMIGANMKDWDKESDSEAEAETSKAGQAGGEDCASSSDED